METINGYNIIASFNLFRECGRVIIVHRKDHPFHPYVASVQMGSDYGDTVVWHDQWLQGYYFATYEEAIRMWVQLIEVNTGIRLELIGFPQEV